MRCERKRLDHGRMTGLSGAAACLTALVLASCQVQPPATVTPEPTASPTPPPLPTQRLDPTRSPTARSSEAPTASATPTSSSTLPTEISEPLPVALTLDEAQAIVLGWLDPTRAPRVEGIKYLQRSVLLHRVVDGYDENDPDDELYVQNRWNSGVAFHRLGAVPPVLVGMVATTEGIDTLYAPLRLGDQDSEIGACSSRAGQRESQFVALDAVSGVPSVSFLLTDDTRDLTEWLAAQPALDVAMVTRTPPTDPTADPTANPSLTPTATPLPTATIPAQAPRLTSRTLPPTLRASFDTYPLRPGSQWVWRVTNRNGGVRWSVSVVTETIVAAWVLGPESVVVDSELTEPHFLTADTDLPPRTFAATRRRYVVPHGIYTDRVSDLPWRDQPEPGRHGNEIDDLGFALEAAHRPLSGGGGPVSFEGEDVPVTTRAGEFAGCMVIHVGGGMGFGTYRWLCPGVGYVRTEAYSCYGMWSNYVEVTELVSWTIPEW